MNERILNPCFDSGDWYTINLMIYDIQKNNLGVLEPKSGEDLEVGRLNTNVIEIWIWGIIYCALEDF